MNRFCGEGIKTRSAGDSYPLLLQSTQYVEGCVRVRLGFPVTAIFFEIFLDTYITYEVYKGNGIRIRSRGRAQSPRDIEPAGVLRTIGGRARAPASHVATSRLQAPAGIAGGWVRGGDRRRTAPSLSAEAQTA